MGNEDDPFIISLIVPSLGVDNEDDPFIISLIVPSLRVGNEDDPFHYISLIVPSLCRWCAQSDSVFATIGYAVQVKVHHTGHQKVSNRLRHCELMIVWVSGYQIRYFWRERRGGGGEVVVSCPDYFVSSMKKVFNGRGSCT